MVLASVPPANSNSSKSFSWHPCQITTTVSLLHKEYEEGEEDGESFTEGWRPESQIKREGSQHAAWSVRWCSPAIGKHAGNRRHDDGNRRNTDAARPDDACGGERCSLASWSSGRRRLGPAVPLGGESTTAGEALLRAVLARSRDRRGRRTRVEGVRRRTTSSTQNTAALCEETGEARCWTRREARGRGRRTVRQAARRALDAQLYSRQEAVRERRNGRRTDGHRPLMAIMVVTVSGRGKE
jgi:hypothetical protein